MNLQDLLKVPYVSNGRTTDGADCYGLVRLARHHLFGKSLMPLYLNVDGSDKKQLTKAMLRESINYQIVKPAPGAIACAYRGMLCGHIAICVDIDGKLMILETDEPGRGNEGARLTHLKQFENRFYKVVYYND